MPNSEIRFRANGPYFNHVEIEKLLAELDRANLETASSVEIDLSAYAYLGMHEMLMVLLALREAARNTVAPKALRLPSHIRTLSFLQRWGFVRDIQEHGSDYFLNSITVGNDHLLQNAVDKIHLYSASKDFLSNRLLETTRISNLAGVLNYVAGMHCPPMMSILVSQLRRSPADAKAFVDVITLELLKNVIQHVNAFAKRSNVSEHPVAPRIGFIAMETFDDEHRQSMVSKYGVDPFAQNWPPFLHEFVNSHTNGFVELSVVDDGAGLMQTLSDLFIQQEDRSPNDDVEIARYACQSGTSRFRAKPTDEVLREYRRLLDGINNKSLDDCPLSIREFITRLRADKEDTSTQVTGYGLHLVLRQVQSWGGIMVIRTGKAYYIPYLPTIGGEYAETVQSYFPGVQIRILLPRPRY